jgi:hypothetical protein
MLKAYAGPFGKAPKTEPALVEKASPSSPESGKHVRLDRMPELMKELRNDPLSGET